MSKWKMVKLNNVFEKQITGEWGTECSENEDGTFILRTTNFTNQGVINYQNVVTRKIDSHKIIAKALRYGDIILEKSGGTDNTPVGRVVYCDSTIEKNIYLCNNFTQAMRVNQTIVVPRYVFYFMFYTHKIGATELLQNKTTGIRNLQLKSYLNMSIPLPTLGTQQKIADILDKASSLIELRKAQIEKLDLLVKSKFIDMFGDPVTNPMGWNEQQLGNLCDIYRGGSPRPIEKYLGGTIPWIKIGDATKGSNLYLYSTKEHIVESGIKKSRYVKKNSLIFANCGVSLGFARIIKFDGCIHDGWLAFENISSSLNDIFLLKSLNHCTDYFRSIAPDGTQPNLNTSIMKSYKQILPPLALQTQFAEFVGQVEQQKVILNQSLEKLQTNFKALMQGCFNGEMF